MHVSGEAHSHQKHWQLGCESDAFLSESREQDSQPPSRLSRPPCIHHSPLLKIKCVFVISCQKTLCYDGLLRSTTGGIKSGE